MTTSLRNTIADLAASFASSILDAIRQMSLDEILAETHGGGGAGRNAPRAAAKVAKAARVSTAAAATAAPTGKAKRKGGRLERRSAGDITALVGRIVSVLESKPSGLRAEQIRDALSLESKELPRPLAEALQARRIVKTGKKRATTYFARGAAGVAKAAVTPATKPAAKATKPAAKAAGGKRGRGKAAAKKGKRGAKSAQTSASA